MGRLAWAVWGALLATAVVQACGGVRGIPDECEMTTFVVSLPDLPGREDLSHQVSRVKMNGRWALNAYQLAPHGRANVIHRSDGLELHHRGRRTTLPLDLNRHVPRAIQWHPEGRRFLSWAPGRQTGGGERVVLIDLERLGQLPPYQLVYDSEQAELGRDGSQPLSFQWAPHGQSVLVHEARLGSDGFEGWVIRQVELDGTSREIWRHEGEIEFVSLPGTCRPASLGPYGGDRLLFGNSRGLHLSYLDGQRPGRAITQPGVRLNQVEWDPSGRRVLLLYLGGGVGWLDLEAMEEGAVKPFHSLDNQRQTFRASWSPHGTFSSWATPQEVVFRRPEEGEDEEAHLSFRDPQGREQEITGFAWHSSEAWLAVTAGDRLYVYDLQSQEITCLDQLGHESHSFLADPHWAGDRILVTRFRDLQAARQQGR